MTRHPIMVSPAALAAEAQQIMAENKIRHLPVVGNGKRLAGLITRQRLALKPDSVSSFNFWEISRYLANLTVERVMLPANEVVVIDPDRTVERAAKLMSDKKIGCLPVIEDDVVVGILSEVDLMTALAEMLGLPAEGVRVTVRMRNEKGQFARLMTAVAEQGWGVMGIGSFPTPRRPGFYDVVIKIPNATIAQVEAGLSQIEEQEVVDVREVV
ncbi:MAG: CBS domain-containing protein [Chloroflexota bacterium]